MTPRRRRLAFTALAVGAAAALLVAVVWYLPSSSLQSGNSVAWRLGWVGGHAFDSSNAMDGVRAAPSADGSRAPP